MHRDCDLDAGLLLSDLLVPGEMGVMA